MLLTVGQIRAARAMLGWTIAMLALRSGIAQSVLRRMEKRSGVPGGSTAEIVAAVRRTFEAAGVTFLADDGKPEGGPGLRHRDATHDRRPGRAASP